VSIAITAEQVAIQASIRQWSARADTLRAVRALEAAPDPAHWQPHWQSVTDLGVFAIALPDHAGGAGGGVTDLAAALEQVTDALVPGPILPTLVAGLVLSAHAEQPAVKELLPAIAAGAASVAVAFEPGTLETTPAGDGGVRVRGRTGPVLGAGTTTHLLLTTRAGCLLLDAAQPGLRVTPRAAVDFSRPLGDVELADVVVPADRVIPVEVRDTAALLCAVEAAAVAGWCLRTAADYAKVRHQFGRPIGTFQAVKHLCAEMLCRSERAAAVVWDAARAADRTPAEVPFAVAAACAVALDAAVDNAKDCIQVLGGIGFTWEHDAHLYLRRALALRQLFGDGAHWRAGAADLALAGARRSAHADLTEGDAGIRQRVRSIAALPAGEQRAALADAGYLAPQWPAPYGLGAGPALQLAIDEELARAGVVRPDLAIAAWAVPTILRHGTDEQRDRFAGPSLRGSIVWCQLFSEPEAGSDLASLRTRAERVDGGWRLTGQKVWTSLAAQADWAICLARTDTEPNLTETERSPDLASSARMRAPKHKGITYFLVDMRSAGLDIRPLREITGRAVFNEVFLDGVFVPDQCVVGAPGDGWRLARGTLEHERVAIGRGSALGEAVEALIDAVRDGDLAARPGVRDRLGGLIADGLAVSMLDLRSTLRALNQSEDKAAAVAKLVGVRQRQAVAEAGLLLCGPDGATADGDSAARVHEFLLTRCLSIAGGTTQVLLSLVAERVLGLPREEVR
jgi:3-oxochol-4-en-24-oyl-CoA dehydrogenase